MSFILMRKSSIEAAFFALSSSWGENQFLKKGVSENERF